jgi:hypothetical protein
VIVHEILAEQMVGERVACLVVVGIGHRDSSPCAISLRRGGGWPRRVMLWHDQFGAVKKEPSLTPLGRIVTLHHAHTS